MQINHKKEIKNQNDMEKRSRVFKPHFGPEETEELA